jgi:hypothetical protein
MRQALLLCPCCVLQYVPIKAIGKGAYGVVCSAKTPNGEKVAIKKIGEWPQLQHAMCSATRSAVPHRLAPCAAQHLGQLNALMLH